MLILVPMCGIVADVLSNAIQFGVITNDAFVVAALPSEIGVAFPAAERCDCGLVGSNNDRQGVAMRRDQRMAVGGVAGSPAIAVIRGRGVQLNATMGCIEFIVIAMRINGIIVGSAVCIGIIVIRCRGVQLNAPTTGCVGIIVTAGCVVVLISDHNDPMNVIRHHYPFIQREDWEMLRNCSPTAFRNCTNGHVFEV